MLGRTIETRCAGPVACPCLDDPLAHRLGERVAVGPAEAARPLGADPDQLVLDPLLARRLGGAGRGEQAGPAVLLLGLLALPGQHVGARGSGARRLALAEPPGQLGRRGRRRGRPVPRGCCRGAGRRRTPWRCARSGCRGRSASPRRSGPAGRGCPTTLVREALVDRRVERHVAGAVHDRVEVGRQRRARRPGRPRRTATRAAISGSTPPAASTRSAKIGFSSSLAIRSAPLVEPLGRTSTDIRRSGTSLSTRCSSASPTKPVTPVSRTCCPASRSATEPAPRSRPRSCHARPRARREGSVTVGRCLSASRRDSPDSRSPEPCHLGAHPVRVGPGVVAQRPADRLAQPERRVVDVGLDGVPEQVAGRSRPRWPTWQITAVRRSHRSSSVAQPRSTGVAAAAVAGQHVADQVGRHLVDHVPPGAGDDQVPPERQRRPGRATAADRCRATARRRTTPRGGWPRPRGCRTVDSHCARRPAPSAVSSGRSAPELAATVSPW